MLFKGGTLEKDHEITFDNKTSAADLNYITEVKLREIGKTVKVWEN